MTEAEYIIIFNKIILESKPDTEYQMDTLDEKISSCQMDSLDMVVFLIILEDSFDLPTESLDKDERIVNDENISFRSLMELMDELSGDLTLEYIRAKMK